MRHLPTASRRTATESSRGDQGAVLLLVLAFLTGTGLIIGALLTTASTSEHAVTGQIQQHSDDYAVDGGIEYGINLLRTDATWCPDTATPGTTTTTINGTTVKVTCSTTSGSDQSVSNWALATLDPNPVNGSQKSPIWVQSGTSTQKCILGPTFDNGGIYLQGTLEVDSTVPCTYQNGSQVHGDGTGTLYYHQSDCTTPAPRPSNLIATSNWACTTTVPVIRTKLPMVVPAAARAPATSTILRGGHPAGTCTVFYPGTYSHSSFPTGIPLTQSNYFVSGVYYFDNVGVISLGTGSNADVVIGGQPGPGETSATPASPCNGASDSSAGVTYAGTGVEFILGGNSWINAGDGTLELFSRQPDPSQVTNCMNGVASDCEGTPAISLRTVPSGVSGWDAFSPTGGSTLPNGCSGKTCDAFYVNSGTNANVAFHGLVYIPDGSATLFATNTSQAEILGGIIAWDTALQASAKGSGLVVAVSSNPTVRTTVITSSVFYAGKTITATAVIDASNTAARDVSIDSWTVNNP